MTHISSIPLPPEWESFHHQYGVLTITLSRPSLGVEVRWMASFHGERHEVVADSFSEGGWATEDIYRERMIECAVAAMDGSRAKARRDDL